jgi:hypothetical protein
MPLVQPASAPLPPPSSVTLEVAIQALACRAQNSQATPDLLSLRALGGEMLTISSPEGTALSLLSFVSQSAAGRRSTQHRVRRWLNTPRNPGKRLAIMR